MRLYEITGAFADLYAKVEAMDGEIPPGFDEELAALGNLEGEKVTGYYHIIRNLEAEQDSLEVEAVRLAARAKRRKASIEFLKQRLHEHLKMRGVTELQGTLGHRAKIVRNGGKLSVELLGSVEDLAPWMLKAPAAPEPDNEVLRKLADKDGNVEHGGKVVARVFQGTHIDIK